MSDIPIYFQQQPGVGGVSATVNPQRGADVAAAPDFSGLGADSKAMAGLGKELTEVGVKLDRAVNETRSARARTDFLTGLEDLRNKYATSITSGPDYLDAPDNFRRDVAALQASSLEGISNDQLRETSRLHMVTHAIAADRFVSQLAARRQEFDNRQMFAQRRDLYVKSASDAPTPVERATIENEFDQDIDDQAKAGWVSPGIAQGHKLLFRSDVAEQDVGRMIAADPSRAILTLDDPGAFPFLDPIAHARLTDAAYKAEAAADVAPQSAAEAEGFKRMRIGMLDAATASNEALPASVQIRLAGMLVPQPPVEPDPRAFGQLMDRAVDDGRGALMAAADDYRAGRISKAHYDRIYDTAQRFDSEIENRPFAIDYRRDLIEQLRPRDDGMKSDGRALADATAAYDKWLDENPNADARTTHNEMLAIAAEGRAQVARENRTTLAMPRFVDVPRDAIDGAALAAAAERLRDAHAQGRTTDDDLIAQADLLRRWRETVQATPKGKGP